MISASGISAFTCTFRSSLRQSLKVLSAPSRQYSTQTLELPKADGESKVYPEKINRIVNDISQLTLLEVADLNDALKKALNISDAPLMPAMMAGAMPAAAKEEEEEADSGSAVQTAFTLKITGIDASKKVAIIKHVKTIMEGMNLVQAKKFVEALPAVVRQDAAKDEVEKLAAGLKEAGAECSIN